MNKFFRRIRQNLLMENKTGKYFKYAIGEIILVMVGILLALQVSNWNNYRIDRISERKILDNIHRDFVANKVKFDSLKVLNYRTMTALDSMVTLFPIIGRDSTKIRAFWGYHKLIKGITFNAYSSTVESVISSNSLELIENDELQGYLVSWNDVLLDFQEEEAAYFKMMNDHYWPYYAEAFDMKWNDIDMNVATMSSMKFQNWVIHRRNYFKNIITAIEEEPIENHIHEIVRLTESNRKK